MIGDEAPSACAFKNNFSCDWPTGEAEKGVYSIFESSSATDNRNRKKSLDSGNGGLLAALKFQSTRVEWASCPFERRQN